MYSRLGSNFDSLMKPLALYSSQDSLVLKAMTLMRL